MQLQTQISAACIQKIIKAAADPSQGTAAAFLCSTASDQILYIDVYIADISFW